MDDFEQFTSTMITKILGLISPFLCHIIIFHAFYHLFLPWIYVATQKFPLLNIN